MATLFPEQAGGGSGPKHSIVDDFMYGSNVAGSSVYIRLGFLRKVYGIVTAQLVATVFISVLFMSNESVKNYVQHSQWLVMVSAILTFGLIFALMVKSRETPTNYILLGMFTICESFMVGVVVTFYSVNSVIEAFVLTLAVTLGLTLYTLQSKRDYSHWGAGLFAVLWVLILAGILQIFIQSAVMDKMIAIAGAIIFSLFIIFDTSMIMHKVSPEEYIFAAVTLYLDIINLFLHILRLLGERNK